MKTQKKLQSGVIKYSTIVLAATLLIVVSIFQRNESKTSNAVKYHTEFLVDKNTPITEVLSVDVNEENASDLNVTREGFIEQQLPAANLKVVTEVQKTIDDITFSDDLVEPEVVLLDWMLMPDLWIDDRYDQQEFVLLEDWMIEISWQNLLADSTYAGERVENDMIEGWMVNIDFWNDEYKAQQYFNIETLLSNISEK